MTTAAVFGCTGAVGSQILATLLAIDAFSSVKTVSRRLPKAQSHKLQAIEEGDITKWGGLISSMSPKPSVIFNAVGTTRATAGGVEMHRQRQGSQGGGSEDVRVHLQWRDQRCPLPLRLRALLEDEGWRGGCHQGAQFRACDYPEAGYDPRKGEAQKCVLGERLRKPEQARTGHPGQNRYD